MGIIKSVVCLAYSRKYSGRCFAGIEVLGSDGDGEPGELVRPISLGKNGELKEEECCYHNGGHPNVLDWINIPLISSSPTGHQSENWLLDSSQRWEKVGSIKKWSLLTAIPIAESLWESGWSSTQGTNNMIPEWKVEGINTSLAWIKIPKMVLSVRDDEYSESGRRRLYGSFSFDATDYKLSVTDPECESRWFREGNGDYLIEESFLTISLTQPFKGNCYKVIAAVIEKDQIS